MSEQTPFERTFPDAVKVLNIAASAIGERAAERDMDKERSMATAVAMFNAWREDRFNTNNKTCTASEALTERDGWMFMVCLKMARSRFGGKLDDYIDGAAYFALAAETI
jgi:hypothetical protein